MAIKIKGIPVTLIKKIPKGKNPFGEEISETKRIVVNNVLVGQPTSEELKNSLDLYGKKISYILGIPKFDNNDWENTKVEIMLNGRVIKCKTVGFAEEGIEDLIPLEWNKKIKVERYE